MSTPISPLQQSGDEHQAPAPQRVIIADDDPHVRRLLEVSLRSGGYNVISAANGHELVQLAQQHIPHLVLVDLMMPQMDGYEAIRQMRNDTRIAHIPMLILTARMRPDDIVVGFETGADDYIAKPFDVGEVLARVKSHLRRAARQPALNPLSGLPGGTMISQELRARFHGDSPLALLHADLDNFKTFNDTYGFSRGDRAILLVAEILQNVLAAHGSGNDFIGHVGGDDFVILTAPEYVDVLCANAIAAFDREVRQFYQPDDWRRGYLSGLDRYGILRRFRLLTISIGAVTNQRRVFDDEEDLARVAAEMKHYAKTQIGSSYAVDQRSQHQGSQVERRGARQRGVLIVSEDSSLRNVLCSTLQNIGYAIHEAAGMESLRQHLVAAQPALILADAQLGAPLWAFCKEYSDMPFASPIVVLTYADSETTRAQSVGVTATLQMPLPLGDVVTCIERLTVTPNLVGEGDALHEYYPL